MRARQVGIIAKREFLSTVKRREFLLITFGLPFFYLLIVGVVGLVTGNSMKDEVTSQRQTSSRGLPPGFYDESGLLNPQLLRKVRKGQPVPLLFPTLEAGQKAVQDKKIRVLVSTKKDFADDGQITVWRPETKPGGLFGDEIKDGASEWEPRIKRALIGDKVPESVTRVAMYPLTARSLSLDPKTGTWEKPDPFRMVGRLVIPYVFSILLVMSVAFSTSYLMHSIVEEKENRIIEVLLSSATHEELLSGKIIGLGAVGLTQLTVWVGGAALSLVAAASLIPAARTALNATPGVIGVSVLMFILGFGFYASIMAGVGAMGTSWRESQQTAGLVVLPLTVPLMFMVVLLQAPNGTLARVLSLFPPTAPIAMMLRASVGGVGFGEVALSAALLALSTWGVVRLSARLFRLSLLLTGQRPGPAQILRALFARGATGG